MFDNLIAENINNLAFLALYLIIFFLAKWLKNITCSYNIDYELTSSDNLAVAVAMSGYYLATAIIFVGALFGPSVYLLQDLIVVGGYSILGLLLLNLSRFLNEKLILHKFYGTNQLIEGRNIAVGAVHFGAYLATGIIAAGAVSGQGGGVVTTLVFFVLGQISLAIFSKIYVKLAKYDVHSEIENNNIAVGIAFSGNMIALAIIIMHSAAGDFINWRYDLSNFIIMNIFAFILIIIVRIINDRIFLPQVCLSTEISEDKNIGAGFLEAVAVIAAAMVIAA